MCTKCDGEPCVSTLCMRFCIMHCSQKLLLDIVCLSMSVDVVFGTGSLVCKR